MRCCFSLCNAACIHLCFLDALHQVLHSTSEHKRLLDASQWALFKPYRMNPYTVQLHGLDAECWMQNDDDDDVDESLAPCRWQWVYAML